MREGGRKNLICLSARLPAPKGATSCEGQWALNSGTNVDSFQGEMGA